jgi:putative endonuclease
MSRKKGNIAEERACDFLYKNGFVIIEQNFYSRFGEIDIIATKDRVLHFIEVKSGLEYEVAISNITKAKLSKIIKTSEVYLKQNILDIDFVYDAIIVTPNQIDMIDNITL